MRRRRFFSLTILLASFAIAADVPRRIVCLSPDLTEMIYGVGAFSRVVGVSNYDAWPPEVEKLPRLGALHSPSLEKLTALRPDLVIVNNAQAPFVEDTLKQLGLQVLTTSNRSIQEVYDAMKEIGRATGKEQGAAALVTSTREGLDRVARRTARLQRVRVALVVDRTPGTLRDLYEATDGSFLAELVGIAGGRIAFPAVKTGYTKLSKEDLLVSDPDVILDFVHGPQGRFAGDPSEAWKEMPELRAVRTRRVYPVIEDYVPHASQRIVQTAELFAKLIHPEAK